MNRKAPPYVAQAFCWEMLIDGAFGAQRVLVLMFYMLLLF